ncbi:16S rRNA (uracil(1498)-N(3))-methyltransferase [Gracilibacillus kekensis]|uniref:Ribosomal RNA small subunit methyltransferase E n=1 Tax=Gracilibacillus kekensis TaxID=1027249 RepID=A0A1M7P3G6_9BACI|nr:16S rRNA (uracil(1498)-N(3))-methyltransferase [Gracilibacillus kekensis]SHN11128.1 16S rRNA (uracil1498-N3)-methyltransferase [Gracilibacillus kekensis]
MQRYFISRNNWKENDVQIVDDDYHHIVNVMRMSNDDQLIANREDGKSAICEIVNITENVVEAKVMEWLDESTESPISITIVQGLPKGDKWEFILQKGTELGASHFIPFQAERSVVKWEPKKVEKKLPRWQKIVKEASEQSHRTKIPTIDTVFSTRDLIEASNNYDWKFFAYEETTRGEKSQKLHHFLSKISEGQSVLICVGPEGGFTENEAENFQEADFEAIRLGPRILRTETAPLYVLANLSYYFEEMR